MAPRSSMTGDVVRVDIPDHGAYVVAIYDPKNTRDLQLPTNRARGRQSAQLGDGRRKGRDRVEE